MNEMMTTVGGVLRERLRQYRDEVSVYACGIVRAIGDGVVQLEGLNHCRYGELLEFEGDVFAMAMDLSADGIGAVLLNGTDRLRIGDFARSTGRVIEIPAGDPLLGRVVSPIGAPLDGKPLFSDQLRAIESPAPSIMERQHIDTPLETGLLAVDSMIPVGRGQRELIIGDRQTGKTTLALDCILNQKGRDVVCIYVAIGQKASSVAQVRYLLEQAGAMPYSVIVAATAGDCAAMQYIAPYAGCAVAESFMLRGKDVLIVYDDLSKHAIAYRAMSLLLQRPPGREAYPGDIFYLHSRLLERAARLSDACSGGSMTALPIVETMASDISAYIPTNVISITDGQIYLETELFNAGIRPAINVGLSVSRVGRAAQHPAMRAVSGKLRLTLAQYRELQIFSQFGSDVDADTRRLLDYGDRLTEILKQPRSSPYRLSEQVALLLSTDYLAGVGVKNLRGWEAGMIGYLNGHCRREMDQIDRSGQLEPPTEEIIRTYIQRYRDTQPESAAGKQE